MPESEASFKFYSVRKLCRTVHKFRKCLFAQGTDKYVAWVGALASTVALKLSEDSFVCVAPNRLKACVWKAERLCLAINVSCLSRNKIRLNVSRVEEKFGLTKLKCACHMIS